MRHEGCLEVILVAVLVVGILAMGFVLSVSIGRKASCNTVGEYLNAVDTRYENDTCELQFVDGEWITLEKYINEHYTEIAP